MAPVRRATIKERITYTTPMTVEQMLKLLHGHQHVALGVQKGYRMYDWVKGDASFPTAVFLVFPNGVEDGIGHYVTLIKRGQAVEMWDPYGAAGVYLSHLFTEWIGRRTLHKNTINFEDSAADVDSHSGNTNTCGEWAALRAINSRLTNAAFFEKFGHYTQKDVAESASIKLEDNLHDAGGAQDMRQAMGGALLDESIEKLNQKPETTEPEEPRAPLAANVVSADEANPISSFISGL